MLSAIWVAFQYDPSTAVGPLPIETDGTPVTARAGLTGTTAQSAERSTTTSKDAAKRRDLPPRQTTVVTAPSIAITHPPLVPAHTRPPRALDSLEAFSRVNVPSRASTDAPHAPN